MKYVPALVVFLSSMSSAVFAAPQVTQQPILTYSQARAVADKAEQVIASHHLGGVVSIVDSAGQTVITERLDGATLANSELAPKKAHSAAAFGVSTASFQQKIAAGNIGLLGNPAVVPLPGGEPLKLNGSLVGAIGVSTPDGQVDSAAASGALTALNAG
ncbi:heme-binding protein [Tatumella sp. TA1]|nr:heme-binding protein [Tatumella sp. TA1]